MSTREEKKSVSKKAQSRPAHLALFVLLHDDSVFAELLLDENDLLRTRNDKVACDGTIGRKSEGCALH